MALESATFINGLVATNPTSSDNVSDGDNHIRLIKATVLATFPNITGAVTKTHTQLNNAVATVEASTSTNAASTVVKRDASGNFAAGTVTAALVGNVTGNVNGNVIGSVNGNATTASKWQTARAITLTGDVSGSASFDGSGNTSITATVADDSHNHVISNVDGLQTALDGKLPTGSNAVSASKWQTARTLTLTGDISGSATIDGAENVNIAATVADDSHNHIIANVDGLQTALDGKLASGGNAVSASKWATSRSITLAGDLSGSVSFDGSANVTLTGSVADNSHNHTISNVTGLQAALDGKLPSGSNAVSASKWLSARTLSLYGDVSGSVSIDGSSNVTLITSVANDSHAHIIGNISGLQTVLDGKLGATANAVSATTATTATTATSASKWSTARTISLGGDLSGSVSLDGSANVTLNGTVLNNSHSHTIANVTGLQTALDAKLSSTATAANSTKWGGYNISTAATGADANTIYFRT